MRDALAPNDVAVAIGTNAFRLYLFDDPGPMVAEGTRVAVLTEDAARGTPQPVRARGRRAGRRGLHGDRRAGFPSRHRAPATVRASTGRARARARVSG